MTKAKTGKEMLNDLQKKGEVEMTKDVPTIKEQVQESEREAKEEQRIHRPNEPKDPKTHVEVLMYVNGRKTIGYVPRRQVQ